MSVRMRWLGWVAATGLASTAAAPAGAEADAFRAFCAKAAAEAPEDAIGLAGRDGWYFLKNELRHIGAGPFWGDAAAAASRAAIADRRDPLPAMAAYAAEARRLDLELLVVPVPCKAFVYPEKIAPDAPADADGLPPRLDAAQQAFNAALRDAGVTVLDLWPELARMRAGGGPRPYCMTDTHWSGAACRTVASMLAREIRKRPWFEAAARTELAGEEREVDVLGDLVRDLPEGDRPPAEKLPLRFVGTRGADGTLVPVEPDPHSPILLLADSHGLVFNAGDDMLARGAGLADQLALETGIVPDLVAVRGSGATPARINLYRKARLDPEYLPTKRLIVWCFSAREFTETSGWSVVPISK